MCGVTTRVVSPLYISGSYFSVPLVKATAEHFRLREVAADGDVACTVSWDDAGSVAGRSMKEPHRVEGSTKSAVNLLLLSTRSTTMKTAIEAPSAHKGVPRCLP